jgi:hypothetical protein
VYRLIRSNIEALEIAASLLKPRRDGPWAETVSLSVRASAAVLRDLVL